MVSSAACCARTSTVHTRSNVGRIRKDDVHFGSGDVRGSDPLGDFALVLVVVRSVNTDATGREPQVGGVCDLSMLPAAGAQGHHGQVHARGDGHGGCRRQLRQRARRSRRVSSGQQPQRSKRKSSKARHNYGFFVDTPPVDRFAADCWKLRKTFAAGR